MHLIAYSTPPALALILGCEGDARCTGGSAPPTCKLSGVWSLLFYSSLIANCARVVVGGSRQLARDRFIDRTDARDAAAGLPPYQIAWKVGLFDPIAAQPLLD